MKTEKAQHTPERLRLAQNLAADLGHLNTGISSTVSLYAAAPELLEALRFVSKMLDDDGGKAQGVMYSDALAPDNDEQTALEYIQAAIAKAEGKLK